MRKKAKNTPYPHLNRQKRHFSRTNPEGIANRKAQLSVSKRVGLMYFQLLISLKRQKSVCQNLGSMLVSVGIDSLKQIDGVWLYAAHRKVVYQFASGIVVLKYKLALG